jgi:hypothetical protein
MAAPKSQANAHAGSPRARVLATPVGRGSSTEISRELLTSEAEGAGRYEIAKLVAAEPDYKVLFNRMMEVAERFVDFDWANLFVYSSNREYSRMVCWYGPRIEYPTRWFYIDPAYRGWLDQAETWMKDLENDVLNGPAPHLLERPDVKIAVEAGTKALIALPVREGGEIKGASAFCRIRRVSIAARPARFWNV